MDTANTAHLPYTTTPSEHHSYLSPPHKKQQKQVAKKIFRKNMAKDIGMTIRKGIVVLLIPCLVDFWGFHP